MPADSERGPPVMRGTARALPVLHGVTSDAILARPHWLAQAEEFARAAGPRGAVQLRGPRTKAARLLELALAFRPIAEETGCWLIVNDRADVALACGADGLQLTSRSLTVADARRVLASTPLGLSVHTPEEAAGAADSGAAWLVAGHVFATSSHSGESERGIGFLRTVASRTSVPVIAIGGVLPERVAELLLAGASGVAAIRGVWDADNAGRAVFDYLSAHDQSGSRSGIEAGRERRDPPRRA